MEGPQVLYYRRIAGNPADHWSGNLSIARRVVSIVVVDILVPLSVGEGVDSKEVLLVLLQSTPDIVVDVTIHQRITRAITTVIRNWIKDLAVLRDTCLLTQIVRAAAEDQEAIRIGSVIRCWAEEVPLSSDGTFVVDNHTEIINIEGRRWFSRNTTGIVWGAEVVRVWSSLVGKRIDLEEELLICWQTLPSEVV